MEEGKVYVITDDISCPLFRLIGASVVRSSGPEETMKLLKDLIRRPDAAMVMVSYDVAVGKEDEIRDLAAEIPKPVITLIPGRVHKPPKLDANKILLRALGFG